MIIDILINQYLLALGEFNFDGFDSHENNAMVWSIFVLATFFTQITMLNMLIAIMGDTFDKITENKRMHATKTQLSLMEDNVGNFKRSSNQNFFMYIINVQEEHEENDSWEGKVGAI